MMGHDASSEPHPDDTRAAHSAHISERASMLQPGANCPARLPVCADQAARCRRRASWRCLSIQHLAREGTRPTTQPTKAIPRILDANYVKRRKVPFPVRAVAVAHSRLSVF
ncbi:hypothetical protein PSAC2689_220007 [Paraburkholderia sacchari]